MKKDGKSLTTALQTTNKTVVKRREFLAQVGGIAITTTIAASNGISLSTEVKASTIETNNIINPQVAIGPVTGKARIDKAFKIRKTAAKLARKAPIPALTDNGDDDRYPNRIASYTKALPHNDLGEVDTTAYTTYLKALNTGKANDFNAIAMGGTLRLENPQGGQAFLLQGLDPSQAILPPAPKFDSAEEAAEMVELYWMALTRDIPFSRYDTDPTIAAACDELSQLSDFRGPKLSGRVTPQTIFRGTSLGDITGPYISQFLLRPFQYGAFPFTQRFRIGMPGVDHMVKYEDWLSVQNGRVVTRDVFDPTPRLIFSGRAIGETIHNDPLYQLPYHAALISLSLGAARDKANPYLNLKTTQPFVTFGGPFLFALIADACIRALTSVWYNKWYVHRRLRPEEFGGRVHNMITGKANYPINPEVLNSRAVADTFSKYGTYLLPQAFPEGCPTHPAYGAGHAAFGAAGVTVVKAFFDEDFVIPNPVMPNDDGTTLVPFVGPPLTLGGELDKLASNIGVCRNTAGVHWRTDANTVIGESIAIGILSELRQSGCFLEDFGGFSLTKFDGTKITI